MAQGKSGELQARRVLQQITRVTRNILEIVDESPGSVIRFEGEYCLVEPPIPVSMTQIGSTSYEELYSEARESRSYSLRFLDGALVQMSYQFKGSSLLTHRLAYLPNPELLPYELAPEAYIQGEPYLDVVGTQQVTVPLRLDFDVRPGVAKDVAHPAAHLTLGQYANCRIPVIRAISPAVFLEFIVSSFYRTKQGRWQLRSPDDHQLSDVTLTEAESGYLHLAHGCQHQTAVSS